jgi:hypothetical protein
MQSLYQAPSTSCTKSERHAFWNKVIIEQNNSGMSMKKFCRLHQLKYSTYKGYRYRIYGTNKLLRQSNKNNNASKFIPLQIDNDGSTIDVHFEDNVSNKITEIKVELSNGNKIILPMMISKANLLWLIKTVSESEC